MMYDKFSVIDGDSIEGKLLYDNESKNYDFIPKDAIWSQIEQEVGLIIAETLEIAIDIPTKRLLFVKGYAPTNIIEIKELVVKPIGKGAVYISDDISDKDNHVSFESNLYKAKLFYDPKIEWMCIGDPSFNQPLIIADQIGLSIQDGRLLAVWLNASLPVAVNGSWLSRIFRLR